MQRSFFAFFISIILAALVLTFLPNHLGSDKQTALVPPPVSNGVNAASRQPNGSSIQEEKVLPNVFVMAPREIDLLLKRATQAIEAKEYIQAVSYLAEVLMTDVEDYFTQQSTQSGTARSLKRTALELVGKLPRAGREAWELRFGGQARNQLDEALAASDFATIASISQRYLHTEAGYEAMLLTGRQQLHQGRFIQAARCFDDIYPYASQNRELRLESAILAATAWMLANETELAQTSLEVLSREFGGTRIPWDQSTFVVSRDPELLQDQLSGFLETSMPAADVKPLEEWALHRGSANRNATSVAGMPLIKPLWRVPIVNRTDDEALIQKLAKNFEESKGSPIPTTHAIFVADTIVMRSPSHIVGIDLRTGKRTWDYPWDEFSFGGTSGDEATNMMVDASRKQQLSQRIWEDHIHGRMSSDGKRLYFIDGLGYAARNKYGAIGGPGQAQVRAFSARDINHLVALELVDDQGEKVEGKLAWRIGDVDGMDQPDLAGIFFLGPPLPIGDQLFVIAEYQNEVMLMALESETGTVQWSQQLATVHEIGSIQLDGLRRLAGAVPSYGEGILVCPTAAGAIVAIDPANQSLLWGYQFPFREDETFRPTRSYRDESRVPGKKWADDIAAIVDGKVLLTPIESDSIHCLDLYTGELIWEAPLKRQDRLFVGGVHEQMFFCISETQIEAFDLNTAESTWTCSLEEFNGPSGQGFRSQDSYFLPTKNSKIIEVDLDSGKVVSSVISERPLGNLISLKGRIISQGIESVDAYYQDAAAEQRANELLAVKPNDPEGLSLRGQLELQKGEWSAAIETFHLAYQQFDSQTNQELLATAIIAGLQLDFPKAMEQTAPFRDIVLLSSKRQEFLQLQVEGLIESRQYLDAFERLIDLALQTEEGLPGTDLKRIRGDDRAVAQSRLYRSLLARLVREADPDQSERIKQNLIRREQQLLSWEDFSKLTSFNDLVRDVYPNPIRDLKCGDLAFTQGDELRALRCYKKVLPSETPTLIAAARVGLLRVFLQSQRLDSALDQLEWLAQQPKELNLPSGKTLGVTLEELRQSPLLSADLLPKKKWQYGEVRIVEGGDVIGGRALTQYYPVQPLAIDDIGSEVYQLDHDQQQNGILRDRYGNELLRFSLRNPSGITEYYGSTYQTTRFTQNNGLLIAISGYDIIAIDLTRLSNSDKAIRWRSSLLPETVPNPSRTITRNRVNRRGRNGPLGWNVYYAVDTNFRRLGAVGPITDAGVCFIKQNQLICLDPLSGDILWRRSDIEPGSDCLGNQESIVVLSPGNNKARIFRISDGSETKSYEPDISRNVLTTFGDRILSYEIEVEQIRLRLDDIATGELVWSEKYPQNSRATLVAPNEFAVLTPSGRFEIRQLSDGEKTIDVQLPPDPEVRSIIVTRDDNQYLLAANHNTSGSSTSQKLENKRQTPVSAGNQVLTLVKGNLWAVSRKTGRLAWGGPVYLDQFGHSDRQTYDSPILVMLRHHLPRTPRGGSATRSHTEVVLIDKRDGRLLAHLDDIPQMTLKMHVTTNPVDQSALIELNSKPIKLSFAARPIPPSPPTDSRQFRPTDDED